METAINQQQIIQAAFPGLTAEEAEEIAHSGSVFTYPAGEVLCTEGEQEKIFYILLNGQVEVSKKINAGESRLLKRLVPGDFFGEMAIIHDAPRAATVITTLPSTVLSINKETFESTLRKNSTVSMAMVREVSQRLRENDEMAIEDLRLKARQLAEAYQQLAEMEHARHEFLTTIAHELRTPLTAANGFIKVIRAGALQGEAQGEALERVEKNLQTVITLVNDILFMQEMELILQDFRPVDAGALVVSVAEKLRQRAERNQVGFNLRLAPNLPQVSGDPRSLERVIHILLDNAIKFSPEGGDVSIEVGYDEAYLWVRVSDNGVGIPPEAMPRLFRRFFRLDEVNGYLFSGAGLGLSIARKVVEQHSGEIDVESELGKGSTFTIRLQYTSENADLY